VLAEFEEREMATFAREGRRVPEARARFGRSGGFCRHHAWLLHGIAAASGNGMPVVDVYGELVARDLARLRDTGQAVADPLERDGLCPACEAAAAALARKADFFVGALAEGGVRAAYADSDGLCGDHLRDVVLAAGADEPGIARFLLSDRRMRLERLADGLAEYDRKRDHRHRHEPKGEEQRSFTEVVRLYAGEAGRAAPGDADSPR
jgi:hypothetical protein